MCRHPDIPPVATVAEGDVFRVECIDWTGGQIKNNDCSDDVKNVDLSQVHYLSGPIAIENAEVGDLLKVEILNLGCLEGDEWGFTGSFAQENGGGFLTDHYPKATKAIWDLEGVYCTSRHIPGIKFAGHIHPGTCSVHNLYMNLRLHLPSVVYGIVLAMQQRLIISLSLSSSFSFHVLDLL